jgi:hypothetical protein
LPKTKAARRGGARMTAKVEKWKRFRVVSRCESVALKKLLLDLYIRMP